MLKLKLFHIFEKLRMTLSFMIYILWITNKFFFYRKIIFWFYNLYLSSIHEHIILCGLLMQLMERTIEYTSFPHVQYYKILQTFILNFSPSLSVLFRPMLRLATLPSIFTRVCLCQLLLNVMKYWNLLFRYFISFMKHFESS